jgi:two-component system response regulator AtoC
MPLQVKLLRVLQERKIRRLGGITDIPVNARIISATNRDVEALVRKGTFREDLYYRLNVFRLHLPPLRERREDIPLLADFLLDKLCSRMGRSSQLLSPAAREKIAGYDFPGNVRELENILERALIFCEGEIIEPGDIDIHVPPSRYEVPKAQPPEDAPADYPAPPFADGSAAPPAEPGETPILLKDIEKNAILAALARYKGNRTRAAQELGITRKTILNKLKSYGMD